MEVTYWDISEIGTLFSFFNEQNADTPYSFSVSSETFERCARYSFEGDTPWDELSDEKLIVCEQNGRILGYTHAAIETIDGESLNQRGILRSLSYQRENRSVGQALLDEAQGYLNKMNVTEIHAGRFGYLLPEAWVSSHKTHIVALLGINGYGLSGHRFLMVMPCMDPIEEPICSDPEVEEQIQPESGNGNLPNLYVRFFRAGQKIGESWSFSEAHYCPAEGAQEMFAIGDLDIDPKEQGKGLGRYLLQRTLWEMKEVGYKTASLGTGGRNHRSQLLYSSVGFELKEIEFLYCKEVA